MIDLQTSDVGEKRRALETASVRRGQPPLMRPVRWNTRRHSAFFWQRLRFGLPLLLTDVALVTTILCIVMSSLSFTGITLSFANSFSLATINALVLISYFASLRLYRNVGMHPVVELERVVTATLLSYLTIALIFVFRNDGHLNAEVFCLSLAGCISVLALPSVRHLVRCRLGKSQWWRQPVVILSHSERAEELIRELNKESHLGWKPVGYVEDFRKHWDRESSSKYCLGDEQDLPEIIETRDVFWGMIDSSVASQSDFQQVMDRHHLALPFIVSVARGTNNTSLFAHGIDSGRMSGICYRSNLPLLFPRMLKRAFDILVSGLALLCLSPLFIVLALAVRSSSAGPIFYSHERMGYKGRSFRIWKFRSMVQNAEQVLSKYLASDPKLQLEWQQTQKLVRDPRATTVGRFLRRTSLDELPQLWNVLNGTMSLIGPRPVPRPEIERYGDVFWLYARTRPGITGLWQVNGRNRTTYEERLNYVSFYARNWSLWLDWYILLKTFRVVVLCEGAC